MFRTSSGASALADRRRCGRHGARASLVAAVALCVGFVAAGARADSSAGLAERLVKLRAEVERLSSEVSRQEEDQRERSRSLSRQKADLELEQSREQLRLTKLRTAIEDQRKQLSVQNGASAQYRPLFDEHFVAVRSQVDRSLPFRRSERLSALDKLAEQKAAGLISTERALGRLWSFVEDELRLTKESGLYRQTLTLDGEERMVDVVRVGMVALYYRTDNGAVGHSLRASDGWSFVALRAPKAKARVTALFDQFKKQIRVGYFELPNAVSGKE